MENNNNFEKFLHAEYEHISNAHFETVNQVTSFFRYYLLIISAPSVILLVSNDKQDLIEKIMGGGTGEFSWFVFFLFLIISLLGLAVCIYMINLRHDAITYARTINGIRKYFYDFFNHSETLEEDKVRVLPKDINFPRYFEKVLFTPIILSFSLINSSYLALSLIALDGRECYQLYVFGFYICVHFIAYLRLSKYRDKSYLP